MLPLSSSSLRLSDSSFPLVSLNPHPSRLSTHRPLITTSPCLQIDMLLTNNTTKRHCNAKMQMVTKIFLNMLMSYLSSKSMVS